MVQHAGHLSAGSSVQGIGLERCEFRDLLLIAGAVRQSAVFGTGAQPHFWGAR